MLNIYIKFYPPELIVCILNRLDGPRDAQGDFRSGLDGQDCGARVKNFKMECVKVKKQNRAAAVTSHHQPPACF